MKKLDLNNRNHQLIIASLANLIEHEGYTAREAIELLDEVKRDTFHALLEIQKESETK